MNDRPRRFLIFTLHGKRYAINVGELAEVMATPVTYPIPRAAESFLGAMNFHGAPTPVLDLASFLHGDPPSSTGSVLVLDHKIGSLAIRIDVVERIVSDIRGLQVKPENGPFVRQSIFFDEETIPILAMDLLTVNLEEAVRAGQPQSHENKEAKAK